MHCAACTRTQNPTRTCPCATCIWLLHPAPTSPKMVLILCMQLALMVLFLSTNAKIIYTHGGHYLQLPLMVFFVCQLAHLPVCTSTHGRTLQLAIVTSYVRKLYSLFKVNNLYWCIFPIMSTFCIIDVIVNSVNSFCSTSIII